MDKKSELLILEALEMILVNMASYNREIDSAKSLLIFKVNQYRNRLVEK